MSHRQIPVEILDLKDKVLVFKGELFDECFVDTIKQNLKSKGFEPAAIVILPDLHYVFSMDSKDLIKSLRTIIKKLEKA